MPVDYPTIYQPLILQCAATILSVPSTVDIIWTTGNTQVRRVNNVSASNNFLPVYSDLFNIPSLQFSDVGSAYQCEVLINSILPTSTRKSYVIPIPGI